jgi:transposase
MRWAAELLMAMPGINRTAACTLIAEIGIDMSRFASARHPASWAGLCPGNNQCGQEPLRKESSR